MDFETTVEFRVVEWNTQTMWRVVCLDEKLLNEYQRVPVGVDTILVSQKGQPLFKSHICLRLICEFGKFLCSSRGYFILQVQKVLWTRRMVSAK